ncbi:hypothetical protein Pmar_PMAR022276 [Perkinsus marinus ATCC 50983]|uniref:Methyltransferase type 11 domain-containing protein n=1 Tax=Perkinsus marinus (strain ATCC 50983 / TXsc) TaxID=423536 RepID=C5KDN5_PERM5|nr:hypothetical protein Pmar_PMAR022276 [Perkinsus marinus ATCC 50983]EER17338.1 hypothetical protein Pmar_PMAR022276 [Perkinsus marinus ATCC 50983]|eukprot:XP_002785542.1 hypothetical protein Pmar_PMAR022276 [Perkinsus marinus ATCC 50983]
MVQKNAKLNGVADRVATAVLDVSKIVNFDERFDYLIASDMLFSTKLAKDVFVACRTFVKPGGTILLGHEKRYSVYRDRATCEIKQDANDEPLELFIGLARQEEWLVHELSPFDDKPQLLAIKIDCV